jgi:hypothetical protein
MPDADQGESSGEWRISRRVAPSRAAPANRPCEHNRENLRAQRRVRFGCRRPTAGAGRIRAIGAWGEPAGKQSSPPFGGQALLSRAARTRCDSVANARLTPSPKRDGTASLRTLAEDHRRQKMHFLPGDVQDLLLAARPAVPRRRYPSRPGPGPAGASRTVPRVTSTRFSG